MTYGSQEDGGATLHLTPAEHERLKARKPVVKRSGDMHGEFEIVVKLTRKRMTPERRRYLGYEEKT